MLDISRFYWPAGDGWAARHAPALNRGSTVRVMLRSLIVIAIAVVIVLVAMALVKTFFSLALLALIVAAAAVAFGVYRLGRRSAHRSDHRSRNRF